MNFDTTRWDLFRKYPQFVNWDRPHNAYRIFRISIGPGWAPIIRNLYEALEQIGFTGEILQIKEKFGVLRMYLGPSSWGIDALVAQAVRESMQTCEKCGIRTYGTWDDETDKHIQYPFYRQDLGWLKTLCGYCYLNRKVLRPSW